MTLSMMSLAHPVDIAMVRSLEDMQKFEHGSRLRILFSSQILPKVCFTADDLHYTLLVGTATCKVYNLRFHLSEPFWGEQGKDVAEINRSDIHINEKRECFSFELVGRDARGTHVCFGCAARYLRHCFIPHAGVSEATAIDIKPAISISKAFTQLLKIESVENIIKLRAFSNGKIITLCDSGLISMWDLGKQTVVCEAEAFTQRCARAHLELYHHNEKTLVVVGYPEERTWVVAIYQLIDRKFSLLTELPGECEEAVSLAINQKGLYILWKSGEGVTRLQAVCLYTGDVQIFTVEIDRETDAVVDTFAKDNELMGRVMKPQRFSKSTIEETVRSLNKQSAPFGVSYSSLPELVRGINPANSEFDNIRDFLETCKTVQSKITELPECVCCSPESGDFPLILAYSGSTLGFLIQPGSKKEKNSLLVESLSNKFVRLTLNWRPDLAHELKALGLDRLSTMLLIARIMRKRYRPLLPAINFQLFSETLASVLEIAIPPGLQSIFLSALTKKSVNELQEQIQALAELSSDPKSALSLRKTKWPAAMVVLVSSMTLKSLYLVSQYALDCLVAAGWINTNAGMDVSPHKISCQVYADAKKAAARFFSLHQSLSMPASDYLSDQMASALSVYGYPVNVLTMLLASKPGRFLGSSDEFDPSVLERWLAQVVSRLLLYLTASEDAIVPRCCTGLLKSGQSRSVNVLLEMSAKTSAAMEFVRGQACANLDLDERAKESFCKGACILDRKDEGQFAKGPWQAASPGGSASEAPLMRYSKIATRSTQTASLKGTIAFATFWQEPAEYMGETAQWTYLFQVLVKLHRHLDVFSLLVHHIDPRLPEFIEIWVREMILEGSVAALYLLPLHPEVFAGSLSVLETLAMNEAFDLLTTLCSPRYRDQTSTIFLTTFGAETRRPESPGSLTAHMALFTLALGTLQYRLAAKAMYHHYENIEEFVQTAGCQDREKWFLLFLQREALLLAITALNCLPEAQAWFVAERTTARTAESRESSRQLVTREEALRRVCRIKRELDKVR